MKTIIGAVLLGMALTISAYAQHGRPMTEEEKEQFRKEIANGEWDGAGSRSSGYHYERRTDWEAVARNPLTWVCAGLFAFAVYLWRGPLKKSQRELERRRRYARLLDRQR